MVLLMMFYRGQSCIARLKNGLAKISPIFAPMLWLFNPSNGLWDALLLWDFLVLNYKLNYTDREFKNKAAFDNFFKLKDDMFWKDYGGNQREPHSVP